MWLNPYWLEKQSGCVPHSFHSLRGLASIVLRANNSFKPTPLRGAA